MPKMNLLHKIIIFVPTLLLIIFLATSSFIFTFCNTSVCIHASHENISLSKDELENSILITKKHEKDSNCIDSKKEIIIVSDNVVLKKNMFEDKNLKKVKKIYFLSSLPSIDIDLYKQIEDRVTFSTDSVTCFTVENSFYIIGDISKDFVSMSKIDDGIYVYEFTYNKGMTAWGGSNGTINLLITEGIERNKKITGIELKADFLDSLDNDLNATATGLIDGKTYIITLKEANGIFSAKINEKKS